MAIVSPSRPTHDQESSTGKTGPVFPERRALSLRLSNCSPEEWAYIVSVCRYAFDHVFDANATQRAVYENTTEFLIQV